MIGSCNVIIGPAISLQNNNIGAEGGLRIGEALNVNHSVTELEYV